jgi:hypothetical protein
MIIKIRDQNAHGRENNVAWPPLVHPIFRVEAELENLTSYMKPKENVKSLAFAKPGG